MKIFPYIFFVHIWHDIMGQGGNVYAKGAYGITILERFFHARTEIAAVYLFGSFGTEFEHLQSDIDLGVVFTRPVTLSEELAFDGALSLHIGHDRIDLVNLNRAPIALQFRALQQGILLYEGDYVKHSDFIEYVIKTYPEPQCSCSNLKAIFHDRDLP